MSDLTLPTIHLNGSSADDLFEKNADAAGAIRAALNAMAKAAPHGRDYYVQGDEAINKAREEYWARWDKLREVLGDLESILESIADQRDARKAR